MCPKLYLPGRVVSSIMVDEAMNKSSVEPSATVARLHANIMTEDAFLYSTFVY